MSGVLVIADHLKGALSSLSAEMLGLALKLRRGGELPVRVAVIGAGVNTQTDNLDLDGVDEIIQVEAATDFDAATYLFWTEKLARMYEPTLILIGHNANGMSYAGGLAAGLGAGFAADIFELSKQEGVWNATRSAYESKLEARLSFSGKSVIVLTVRGGAFKPPLNLGKAERKSLPAAGPIKNAGTHGHYIDVNVDDVDISRAEFILAIGRGVQDAKHVSRFAALAERLGAVLAGSRPVVDAGWLEKSRQVGLTGKAVPNCKLYVALGISGAEQHLSGIKHIDTVLAVNTDETAPIFNAATFGATCDLFALTDALERQLEISKSA